MLMLSTMEHQLSAYKEFSRCEDAEEAVRALKIAGFENVETEELQENLVAAKDVGTAPPKKSTYYLATGFFTGLAGGFILGLLLFGLPSSLVATPYANVIMIFGTILCTVVGAVVGLQEGTIYSKRNSPEPTSSDGGHCAGVRVRCEHGHDLLRAKAILETYGKPEWGERIARWRSTHWIPST